MTARPEHRQPDITELDKFIAEKGLVFDKVETPAGAVYALTSGVINNNDPYEAYMLEAALWAFNGGV